MPERVPEKITCIQLWQRYATADKRKDELRYKWKRHVGNLHDTEYRIEMVKAAINQEYSKLPDKSFGAIPIDIQEKLCFLHKELKTLKCTRKELHYIIPHYKKDYEKTATRANRYLMAYRQVNNAIHERVSGSLIDKSNAAHNYPCLLFTNKLNDNIVVVVEEDGEYGKVSFKF